MNDEELDMLLQSVPDQSSANDDCIDDGILVMYHHRKLDAEQTQAVELHLAQCASCRSLLVELTKDLDPETYERAKDALLSQTGSRHWGRWAIGGVLAAAAVILLFPRPEAVLPKYELRGPFGGVKAERSVEAEQTYFTKTSQLELVLVPEKSWDAAKLTAAVYVQTPDGTWVRASDEGLVKQANGAFSYTIEAQKLLGTQEGLRTIHAVLTQGVLQASAPDVKTLRSGLGPHQWFTAHVTYRTSFKEED